MTAPSESPADTGARRAREYLQLVEAGRTEEADALLAGLSDTRELVFVGAGFTALARRTGRTLPTAMRAQASTRQVLLGQLRDRNRRDVEGLRGWLRQAAEEVLLVTRLAEAARQRLGEAPTR
ncbi:hypothetical protein [Modestobacter versicolor]|uniref:Uncharacterized protein n=1 Tax=Modestobacter versicolor TaxID=429133 RepID=A0A323VB58_9ACTN|nr:hypothetical protein [Modestobacter versicolor]MBB3676069.1 hypothetical protein [Modestobacter versicolor]PZA21410.1 hypothetical protein DMO24_10435 [Modestobacter versicolor]